MAVSGIRVTRWVLVIGVSIVLGFLLGNTSQRRAEAYKFFSGKPVDRLTQVSFADIAEKVTPAVVSVISTKIVDLNEVHDDLEFWYPMRPDDNSKRKSLGFGSGFVVEAGGLIVTNQHVIEDSRNINVRLYDGSEYPAELLGSDAETDLALMKIKPPKRLEKVSLGNSDQLRVGDWVMAVGNPYNYDHSVTVGVVSAKDRKIDENPYESYVQTDAAINFGNSGGPLFNANGEVVAIATAISTRGRNIGFAIPINLARLIVRQLEEHGRVIRGFLGLTPESIDENIAKVLQLHSTQGIMVSEVSPMSAAERAGIKRYDVITHLGDEPVLDRDSFRRKVAQVPPGTELHMRGIRNDRPIEFMVLVRERPSSVASAIHPVEPETKAQPSAEARAGRAGITVQEVPENRRKLYRIESGTGVLIVKVDPISPAADAGLNPDDVILEINKHPIASLMDYQKVVSRLRESDAVMLLVARPRTSTKIITMKLEGAP
ncbi:MAG: trypsin-like peptidase domain-containing protein [Terriglobia bacterium]